MILSEVKAGMRPRQRGYRSKLIALTPHGETFNDPVEVGPGMAQVDPMKPEFNVPGCPLATEM